MFGMIWALFQACFSKEHFLNLIQRHYPKGSLEYLLIKDAYEVAEEEFRDIKRLTGDPYISHLRITAVLVFCATHVVGIRDAGLIAAALLHDLIEDFPHRWETEMVYERFGVMVLLYILDVSKPGLHLYDYNKDARDIAYRLHLCLTEFESLLLKICDNMQNLTTLWAMPLWKQERVIKLALEFYLVLAKRNDVFPGIYRAVILYAQVRYWICIVTSRLQIARC